MSLSWISDRSLKLSPRVRLVADGESDALRRKLEQAEIIINVQKKVAALLNAMDTSEDPR